MNQPTWNEIEYLRHKREDESVARKYSAYRHLGRGHMQPELCRVQQDY